MKNIVIEELSEIYVHDVWCIENELIGNVSEKSIADTIVSETLSYYILLLKGELVGFLECSIISPECELYDIGIKKEFQGKGYANLLMDYFIALLKQKGCDTVFLEVNSINNKALNLYKKYGFEQYGLRENYYGKSDAVLMKLELN